MTSQNILKQIEELIEGWNHQGYASSIERDIALAKVRDLYEYIRFLELPLTQEEAEQNSLILNLDDLLISNEAKEEPIMEEPIVEEPMTEAKPKELEPEEPEVAPEFEPESEPEPAKDTLFDLEAVPKKSRSRRSAILSLYGYNESEPAIEPEPIKESETKPQYIEVMLFDDPVVEVEKTEVEESEIEEPQRSIVTPEESEEQLEEEPEEQSDEEPETSNPEPTESIQSIADITTPTTVIGETINSNQETIGDRYATETPSSVVMEQYGNDPIASIKAGLGVNERYLLARDLFDGDATQCNAMLIALDECEDYDDAVIYIVENYMWSADSPSVSLIMNLLDRKFNS